MEQYVIKGGNRLNGEIEIGGAKNAALAILAAQTKQEIKIPASKAPKFKAGKALKDSLN